MDAVDTEAPAYVKIRVFLIGVQKPIIDKLTEVERPSTTSLRMLIDGIMKKEKSTLCFNADDHITKVLDGTTDLVDMLDRPVSLTLRFMGGNVISVSTTATNASNASTKSKKPIDLMEENRTEMHMVESKYSLEHVHDFQQRFLNKKTSRTNFLRDNKNTPTYDQQIEASIVHAMSNPTNGLRRCGYNERRGDKSAREKAAALAASEALSSKPKKPQKKSNTQNILTNSHVNVPCLLST